MSEFTKFAFIANTISFMSLQTFPVYACLTIIQESIHNFPRIGQKKLVVILVLWPKKLRGKRYQRSKTSVFHSQTKFVVRVCFKTLGPGVIREEPC